MSDASKRYSTLPHVPVVTSRRDLLFRAGMGFGGLALGALMAQDEARAEASNPRSAIRNPQSTNPLAPKPPQVPARADSVIFLFMEGGPSHLDLFDPKPELQRLAGQPLPASFGRPITSMGVGG